MIPDQMTQLENNGLTMTELFCGAGVGAIGFKKAGFDIIDAIDNISWAVDTYNHNIGNHAHVENLFTLPTDDIKTSDVITGGFPCKPFSTAGKGEGQNDERFGNLAWQFCRIIKEKQPKAFIAENVKGLLSDRHRDFFNYILGLLIEAGYCLNWKLMNCHDYGVPQSRERVFIVGIRNDLDMMYEFPSPNLPNEKYNLRDAIGDLPDPDDLEAVEKSGIKNQNKYHMGGFSPRDLTANRQRQWHMPSYTILSSGRHNPIYPEPPNFDFRKKEIVDGKLVEQPPRRFTIRECLRIQSVPDEWYYDDKISLDKQYQRCSGIPPVVAYKLSVQLAKYLTGEIQAQPNIFNL